MSLSFGLFISVYNTRACAGLVNAPHNNHCLVAYFLFGRVKVMSYCLDLSESDDYFIVTLGCILGKPWKTFGVFFPFCLFFFFGIALICQLQNIVPSQKDRLSSVWLFWCFWHCHSFLESFEELRLWHFYPARRKRVAVSSLCCLLSLKKKREGAGEDNLQA